MEAISGDNFPVMSKTSATFDAQWRRVRTYGMILIAAEDFFPLRLGAKLSSDIEIEISSDFEYHFIPPTPTDTPSLVRCDGGSAPDKVIPFSLKLPLEVMTSSSPARLDVSSWLISPVTQSSTNTTS